MSLRARVLRGGVYLILRQGLGAAISGIGMILVARAIGPGAYGPYAAALGVYLFLLLAGQLGVNIYLIRRKEEPQPQDYNQAFSLLLLLGLAGAGLAILALPLFERWIQIEGFGPVAIALFALLPIALLQLVPLARQERALNYRKVALIELSGEIATYLVAVPLAYQGWGAWAPVGGMWASQLLTLVLLYQTSDYRPRLYWESARVRAMVGYGLGTSSSEWLWNLRLLVNPLIVGRYAGAEAVAYVSLATGIVERFSAILILPFLRLSMPTFARIQEDRARLVRAVSEGMSLQLIALGPLLAGFGLVAPWIVPLLFGSQWLPAVEVYPFIAVNYLSVAAVHLPSYALYVLRRTWVVTLANLVHLILLAGSAFLLVPYLDLRGYEWAQLIALPSNFLVLVWFHLYVGRPRYSHAGIWFTAWAIPLFSWQLGVWVWIILALPLVWPATRRELRGTVAMILRKGHKY